MGLFVVRREGSLKVAPVFAGAAGAVVVVVVVVAGVVVVVGAVGGVGAVVCGGYRFVVLVSVGLLACLLELVSVSILVGWLAGNAVAEAPGLGCGLY